MKKKKKKGKRRKKREINVKSSRRISRYRKKKILSLDGKCKLRVFRTDFEPVFVRYKSQQ